MKKNKIIKIIASIVLLLLILFGGFLYIREKTKYESSGLNMSGYILGEGIAPDLTDEEIKALLQKQVDKSKIAFSIYTEPTFKGKLGTIMFANPRYSAHNLDLEVRLGNKVIIRTEKIAPDQYIENIELIGKALEKGKHNATAYIKGYDRKTNELVGEVAVDMIITSK
ncbi:MAG: hypothetical protein SOR73_13290 [Romboutsia timonensis]|uniref:hypothetical protein n=1 Tax=Romboutsia timonensis TaxID=1776391 RepID=UPI002A74AE72|nr:hypothetical protein [Romboutsia timonensis]MDY3002629.1 hypothetical protein [Romboutsia timonensis]